jgi:diguanylate cyclase (GGDEF)-like protein/PAS domain S-box-containing protein
METIIVVDDNRQISNFLAGNVLPSLGYETLVAYDGQSGLDLIRQNYRYIDLMILDLQLPDMSGLEVLRQLSAGGFSVPTIFFTGEGSEQVAVEAFRLGVQDYLNKPVDVEQLQEAISRALTTSRLRRETEKLNAQLKEQVNWLTILAQVGKMVTSTLDVDSALKRIVEAGVLLTRADEGFLALVDAKSGKLTLRAVKNIDEDKIKTLSLPVTDSLAGSVLQSRRPLRSTQNTDQPLKVSTGYLVYSLLHVPLISHGVPVGVLSVDNRTTRQSFTAVDEAKLLSLSDYAAVALENANLFQKAQEELGERQRAEGALRKSEERYALAVLGANDGIWDWDLKTQKTYYSPRWKSMLGYSEAEIGDSINEWFNRLYMEDRHLLSESIRAHIRGDKEHFQQEHRLRSKDGQYRWYLARGLVFRDEQQIAVRMAGSLTDISDRKRVEEKLMHDARHDTLTNLLNRTSLEDRLRLAMDRLKRRPDYLFAVLFIDLDRFKDVNDSFGHSVGDQLIVAVGQMLRKIIRPMDSVARLSGDEFAVLLEDIRDVSDATRVAERIRMELLSTDLLVERQLFVTASIGIVLSTTGYEKPEDLLRDADIAMYRAKARGRDAFEIFDPTMRDRIMSRLKLEAELRRAVERQEFMVHYQPILSLRDGNFLGFEALIRWNHPERGLVSPGEFIPIAEETGLIMRMDRWVLREACQQIVLWQKTIPDLPPLRLSVNMSSKQFFQPDWLDYIDEVLSETHFKADYLNLEVTESEVMENHLRTLETLEALQQRGIQVQIDDFGIGYSSLGYLSQFSLGALKIDKSFVQALDQDNTNHKIIQAIIMLTHGLGLHVCAEGVETPTQLERLDQLGCEFVQGYLFARPQGSAETAFLLERIAKEGGATLFPRQATSSQ